MSVTVSTPKGLDAKLAGIENGWRFMMPFLGTESCTIKGKLRDGCQSCIKACSMAQ